MKKTFITANQFIKNISIMFLLISAASCTKENNNPFLLRVENHTSFPLKELVFYALEGEHNFGVVTGGATSEYKVIGSSYNAPVCSFLANGNEYRVALRCATPSPEKISTGHYALRINSLNGSVADLELVKE